MNEKQVESDRGARNGFGEEDANARRESQETIAPEDVERNEHLNTKLQDTPPDGGYGVSPNHPYHTLWGSILSSQRRKWQTE